MKLINAIASTTHIDLHGGRFSKDALEGMGKQINEKYLPVNVNHKKIYIGVILAARVKPFIDREWGLEVICGIFETKEEKNKYRYGEKNTEHKNYISLIDNVPLKPRHTNKQLSKKKLTLKDIESSIELWFNTVEVLPDGSLYMIKGLVASHREFKIYVYTDHPPPHFHIISRQRNIDARFDLQTLELISVKRGSINQSEVKKIQAFFNLNKHMLKHLHEMHAKLNPA